MGFFDKAVSKGLGGKQQAPQQGMPGMGARLQAAYGGAPSMGGPRQMSPMMAQGPMAGKIGRAMGVAPQLEASAPPEIQMPQRPEMGGFTPPGVQPPPGSRYSMENILAPGNAMMAQRAAPDIAPPGAQAEPQVQAPPAVGPRGVYGQPGAGSSMGFMGVPIRRGPWGR